MERGSGLAYEVVGDGEPVLLIHGSHIADSFLPVMLEPVLRDQYRLIRCRRRGFADSPVHSGPFSIEQQANDVAALLRELKIGQVHVAGHSYGAAIALQLAIQSSDTVTTLVLLEPPLISADRRDEFRRAMAPAVEAYRSGDTHGAVDKFITLVFGPNGREEILRHVPGGPQQAEDDARTFFEVELPALAAWKPGDEALRGIRQPVLLVRGGDSGELIENLVSQEYRRILSLLPHGSEIVLPGLNHLMQMRNPGLVAATVAEFISARGA